MRTLAFIALCEFALGAAVLDPRANAKPSVITAEPAPASSTFVLPPLTTDEIGMRNWRYFNEQSAKAWKKSSYQYSIEKVAPGSILNNGTQPQPPRKAKRAFPNNIYPFNNWHAWIYNYNYWGYWLNYPMLNCRNNATHDYKAGMIMKMVVNVDAATVYKFWWNGTYLHTPKPVGRPTTTCTLYNGVGTQCIDSIWNPTAAIWEPRGFQGNGAKYWTSQNSTYGYHTVRTVFDCLLNQVVVEYFDTVQAFGRSPIQYQMDGMKYYRFYDANDFAWFAACPPGGIPSKTRLGKRQLHGKNSNPIWDFGVAGQRDSKSDMTPFNPYLIENYYWQNAYTAMFWPAWNDTTATVMVDGEECQLMALSRPGLRHRTAKMIFIPPEHYPPITEESLYPAGWNGYSKFAMSWDETTEYDWW